MKKTILTLVALATLSSASSNYGCKLYRESMINSYETLYFKAKNKIEIYDYEIKSLKNKVALTMGHCNGDTKIQKLSREVAGDVLKFANIVEGK